MQRSKKFNFTNYLCGSDLTLPWSISKQDTSKKVTGCRNDFFFKRRNICSIHNQKSLAAITFTDGFTGPNSFKVTSMVSALQLPVLRSKKKDEKYKLKIRGRILLLQTSHSNSNPKRHFLLGL